MKQQDDLEKYQDIDTTNNDIKPIISFTKEDIEDGKNPKNHHVITTITSSDGKKINITNDVDQAMEAVLSNDNEPPINFDDISSTEWKKLLLKIDLYLIPIMCLLYCFQFMDKMTTSYASILGLRQELKMVGDMYSWTGTSFYLGYLVFEFPASMLLQRFPVTKTVSIFIILWGVILCLHSVPNQYGGFITLRTLLGMLELAVTPAFTIITSQWYKKKEQFLRTTFWFGSNGMGNIIGLAIAYGLYQNQINYSIDAWKLIFIVTGCLTIFVGMIIMVHIPDTPTKAWFLNDKEKRMVVERIRTNQQGFGNTHFKKHQFIEAVMDHRTWLFIIYSISSNLPNGGLTSFLAILLNGDFGYNLTESLLMQMPPGAIAVVGCIILAYCGKFTSSRLIMGMISQIVVIICNCLFTFAKNDKARLAGLYISAVGPVGFICCISCVSSNVAGHTKKITANAMFLIAYCVGNLVGPQTFIESQAPNYVGAKIAIVICSCVSFITLVLIYLSYYWDNKSRDNKARNSEDADLMNHIENYEFADLTDKENLNFRYSL